MKQTRAAMGLLFALASGLFVSVALMATAQARPHAARTFSEDSYSLLRKSLAHSCLALIPALDGVPCQPAATPLAKTRRLRIQGLWSSGIGNYNELSQVAQEDLPAEVISTFFGEERTHLVDGSVEIYYLSPDFNFQITPKAVRGFAEVRNEASPQVDLRTVEEESVRFQWGRAPTENFSWGIQSRWFRRASLDRQFSLFELGTEQGERLLNADRQSVMTFEPGVLLQGGGDLNPRLSALLAYLGITDQGARPDPDFQLGFGLTAPTEWGDFDFLIDFKSLTGDERVSDRWHSGLLFRRGEWLLSTGFDSFGTSAGVHFEGTHFGAGTLLQSTRGDRLKNQIEQTSLIFQFSAQVEWL